MTKKKKIEHGEVKLREKKRAQLWERPYFN